MRWAPYIWLVYLPGVFVAPVLDKAVVAVWMTTIGAVLVFIPLYLYAYTLQGRRPTYGVIALIASLGVALTPINGSAAVFMVYASSLGGMIRPPRHAIRVVAILLLVVTLEALIVHLRLAIWAGESFFTAIVWAVNAHFTTVQNVEDDLRRAREEIAHLAAVRERERIARDLHDVLGHTLSLITLKAALAERLVSTLSAQAEAELRGIGEIARGALGEVRSAVAGYRESGVTRELASARQMLSAAGVQTEVDSWRASLNQTEDVMLSLVLREAVTNVARHAAARTCVIRLCEKNGARVLEVIDDGAGGCEDGAPGAGIHGMVTRVEALGGSLSAGCNYPQGGWRVAATLPPGDRRASASDASLVDVSATRSPNKFGRSA